ncbi:kinase-like domain-containing protein [Baffinella frigidus]|nr:kinase-like domain-containing protein [Cryptophyta sp. CCMP2293]
MVIGDFGLATRVDTHSAPALQTTCGTPQYMAPEIVRMRSYSTQALPQAIFLDRIEKGKYSVEGPDWAGVSTSAKSLVKELMTVDPTKRLTPQQALQHPWISRYKEKKLPGGNLGSLERLKKYNAMRKLKASTNMVQEEQQRILALVNADPSVSSRPATQRAS